jgi:hypothetical protein
MNTASARQAGDLNPLEERAPRELAILAARCAAGEAEIATAYFESPKRTSETDAIWLEKQAGRELESTFTMLKDAMEVVGRDLGASKSFWVDTIKSGIDRHWLEDHLFKVNQELNHGNHCVDILERLTGRPADVKEIVRKYNRWNPDPSVPNNTEWCNLAKLFREQEVRPEPWAKLITSEGLLEGGSCGMFYSASLLKGNEIDDLIGKAFVVVLRDERGHGPANLFSVHKYIKSEADLEGAKQMLRERGEGRLKMRNEQFAYPLPAKRLTAIMDGDVDLGVVREIWGDAPYRYVTEQ